MGDASSIRSRARRSTLPPSGFVAGIYARNDVKRAVYKAPANEVVNSRIGFEQLLNKAQQEVLNPEGINCFRFFEGRGFRLWGARTISSDPGMEVRQSAPLLRLPRTLDRQGNAVGGVRAQRRGAVGQRAPHRRGFPLQRISDGRAAGRQAREGLLRALRSLDDDAERSRQRPAGLPDRRRAAAPAEFVIFRIGQWTADRKV